MARIIEAAARRVAFSSLPVILALLTIAGSTRAGISIDAVTSRDITSASNRSATSTFSTTAPNELLLAFISTDASSSNITVTGVSGAGLTWAPVKRTNGQLGTSEIWRAFASAPLAAVTVTATLSQSVLSSITVISFIGADASGTNGSGAIGAVGGGSASSGAPTATLVTTRDGSLVLGVGNDWDSAIGRSVGAGQVLVHQDLASVGDTYWVQRQAAVTASSGTSVTINDTAPTSDRYNLSIVEVLQAAGTGSSTFSVSGSITPGSSGAGASIVLTQNGTTISSVVADSSGAYAFTGIANGTYTATPSKNGFTFSPANQTVTVNGANASVPVFTATATTGTISGTITPSANGSGATVALTQNSVTTATITANVSGSFSFANVANGGYVVIPTKPGYVFSPANSAVTVNGSAVAANFTANPVTISGSVTPATSGVTIQLSQNSVNLTSTLTDASGNYTFSAIANGTYVVSPSKAGLVFNPASQTVPVSGSSVTVAPFTTSPTPTWSASGSITPAALANGSTLTLSQNGSTLATTTADVSGNYAFSNLANGSYTVAASKPGFSFNPTTQPAPVNGSNIIVPAFTITQTAWTISGTISPASSGAGSTVTLSQNGTNLTTVTADASGNYAFPTLPNGSYTVTPSRNGFTFSPVSQSQTINGADVSGVNFTVQAVQSATLAIDVNTSFDLNSASATLRSPTFSTLAPNELLLAFIGTDFQGGSNTMVTNVTGAGLTWALVRRTNVQSGTAEVWRAFAPSVLTNVSVTATLSQSVESSITIVSFSGVDTTGINGSGAIGATISANARPGAPTGTLTTTRNNSWVFAVGNDYDNAIARTVGSGQKMVHQDLAPINDTYWVQMMNAPTPLANTSVTINDTAPTSDRFNLTLVEVLPSIADQTPIPDLMIGKSHANNFSQGQIGAAYTLTVTNVGGAATTGTATVTDTLPGGLTATAISGTNWNCTLGTLTCTRTDALAAGASYPPITLTVNVASDAPGSVTNSASVSGGGETNTANDTATDITNIATSSTRTIVHVGGAAGHPVLTNQTMTLNYTPVGTGNAVVVLVGCRNSGVTAMSLSAPGWTFTPISGLVGPSALQDFISTFGAITPNTVPVTFTITIAQGSGNCSNNDTTIMVDEFSGNDPTGGTTTFDAHNESLDPAPGGICTGAPITPANNNDAIWYGCFDNVTGVSGAYTKGQDDTVGDWTEYMILSGGIAVVQNPGFITNPNFSSFGLGGVSIKPKSSTTVPDLVLNKTHSGNFVQGQTGATYTLTVSNVGGAATAGTVTVKDTLPAGLTASAIAGTSWSCTLATLTCTRTDALAAGASYPPITLTVNVASTAPASVTNSASVSGGGETNTANDTAADITNIASNQLPGIKLVQSNVNGNENGTANLFVAFTAANTAGNFLIVTGTAARPASTLSVSDTLGNSYSAAIGPVTDTAQDVTLYVWYVPSCKGGANTVTIVASGTAALEIHVSEWSGVASANPLDVTSFATGTGTSVSSGAQTTSSNGELIFGYGWVFNTASAGNGFTPISLVNGDLDEYQIQSFAGGIAATFTQTSGTWAAIMATFRSQASVTGPNVNITSPAANATVAANANVSANASDLSSAITGVQFLLDGNNLGARVTSPPYSLTWDTTTATAGVHTLSATVFDSAGFSAPSAPVSVSVDNSGSPAIVGSWSSPVTIPTVAVNLLLLKNNSLMFYEDGSTATVWDYLNNKFTSVPTSTDLFCSGHALMADGRVLAVGGYGQSANTIGIANAEIFDPSTNAWTSVPPMAFRRWYPTATTLSDGRILVTAGWQTTNHTNAGIPEIYDPVANNWTQLTNANNPFETYPFMFMLSDGRIIHTGGTEFATNTDVLDINAQTWTVLDSRIIDGGSATMFWPGKILKSGSAADSQSTGPSSSTAFVLDTTQSSPSWQQVPSMAYPRSFLNLTTLPDGSVLATGGETDKNGGNISNAVYAAELWSPRTQTWTTMAAMHTPREYHSTALLLPDGRVVESGMGSDFGNVPDEMSAEFYSPPYLFKGARPTITQAPTQIHYAANFFVASPDAASITSAVLIRTGAVTHFFDQGTRFVPVTFQQAAGGLNITAPANGFAAPPGYYMLFLVNSSGVPSVAPIMQVGP